MTASPIVLTHVYLQTSELKQAIVLWAKEHNMTVQDTIKTLIEKMLDSKDYTSNIEKFHKEATGELSAIQKTNMRRVTCGFSPELMDRVDVAIRTLGQVEKAKLRGIFINEAIRRYLEPHLIEFGFLKGTAFLDKKQAAMNLKALRLKLRLTQQEFTQKFFAPEGVSLISFSQYAMIERTGKGSLDRLIEFISITLHLDKARFYDSTLEFAKYIKVIN
ncbi:MAG TPA: hypothetical protein DD730_04545 [Desulfosporosinus sp.]|jgi:hypothetical protein|nr:hypothetical protein [Desulfosporosinus sp.]